MKHYLLIITLLISFSAISQTNQFTIRVHDKTHLQTKTEYSQKHKFLVNDLDISNIKLNLYLACPETGCSDWDYSISVLLRKVENNDTTTYQLGRMMTPYSGAYNSGDNAKTLSPQFY